MIHLPRKRCNLVPPCAVKIQRKSDVCVTCHETLHLIKIEILSVRKKCSLCTANIARPHLRVTDLVPYDERRCCLQEIHRGKLLLVASYLRHSHHPSSSSHLELIHDTSQLNSFQQQLVQHQEA